MEADWRCRSFAYPFIQPCTCRTALFDRPDGVRPATSESLCVWMPSTPVKRLRTPPRSRPPAGQRAAVGIAEHQHVRPAFCALRRRSANAAWPGRRRNARVRKPTSLPWSFSKTLRLRMSSGFFFGDAQGPGVQLHSCGKSKSPAYSRPAAARCGLVSVFGEARRPTPNLAWRNFKLFGRARKIPCLGIRPRQPLRCNRFPVHPLSADDQIVIHRKG